MAVNMTYRCLNCGADLKWNPQTENWQCEYCDKGFTLAELEAAGKAEVAPETVEKETVLEEQQASTDGTSGRMVAYTCNHCGAQIVTDETTSATICAYCGSPVVISEKLIGDFAPEQLIPFRYTKEQAVATFKQFIKKPLTPKLFYTQATLDKITGIYVPFWLYDGVSDTDMIAEGTKVTSWSDKRNHYTRSDVFRFHRAGNIQFTKIPVDCSAKSDDAAMDSLEPFLLDELVDFSPAYLAGFLAERYSVPEKEGEDRAAKRAENSVQDELLGTLQGFAALHVQQSEEHFSVTNRRYVLLPVWFLNTQYRGKNYLFAMNGQTGKMIGNAPISAGKSLLCGAGSFAASALAITAVLAGLS